jgi:L-seryl-tRNA(Ser) seleniumtransferase
LEEKVGDGSAMLLYLPSVHDDGPIPLDEILAIGRRASVPVMVDAADKLPPPENLRRLNALGIDLVGFSGGKGLSGPQCTGLLMGRSDLIEAAYLNSQSPGVGRPMKVGKEEIVGLLAAVELYINRDHDKERARWEGQLDHIEGCLRGIPGVETEQYDDTRTAEGRRLAIRLSDAGRSGAEVRKALTEGSPRIFLGSGKDGVLTINPQTMRPGEERLVAERLLEAIGG